MINLKQLMCGILLTGATIVSNAQTSTISSFPVKTYHLNDSSKIGNHSMYYRADLELPTGKGVMIDSIMSWARTILRSKEKVDVNKMMKDDAKAYYAEVGKDIEEDEMELEYSFGLNIKIFVTSQSPTFCTLRIVGYDYRGGAHGMPFKYGVTFRRRDGHKLNWKDFTMNRKSFSPIITEYCDGESLDMKEMKINGTLQLVLPTPDNDPWIEGDDIVFSYGAYEVGSYAQGMPEAIIPATSMPNTLSPSIRTLCKSYTDAQNAKTRRYAWKGKMGTNISFSLDLQENKDGIIAGYTTYYRKNGKIAKIPVYGHKEKDGNGNFVLSLDEFNGKTICGSYSINMNGTTFKSGSWSYKDISYDLNEIAAISPTTDRSYLHPVESANAIAPYFAFEYETDNQDNPTRGGSCDIDIEQNNVLWHMSQVNPNIAEAEGDVTLKNSYFYKTEGEYKFKAYVDKNFILVRRTNPEDGQVSSFGAWTTLDGTYVRTSSY